MKRVIVIAGICGAGAFLFSGCAFMNDFTTLFNIYYNANRIMNEVEEPPDTTTTVTMTRQSPGTTQTQQPGGTAQTQQPGGAPQTQQRNTSSVASKKADIPEYYEELIRHPVFDPAQTLNDQLPKGPLVAKKLDSVVMKCSKILKFHSNSSYVPNALYLMAKANYYKGTLKDYLLSKQECDEFIATFPDNDLYVDAHLLLAQDLIAMKEDEDAHRALSRCIDIALPHKRYDVVGKALRYTADLALKHGDFQSAIDPYLHAMMLSHNDDANTEWQLEVGLLELETQHFLDAAQSFRDVFKYDPDTYPSFKAKFGLGIALRELNRIDSANAVFAALRDKGKYSEWKGYSEFELANDTWASGKTEEAGDEYTRIDTTNKGTELSARAEYEYAMRSMAIEDYLTASKQFDKVSRTFVSYSKSARDYYTILSIGMTDSKDIGQLRASLEHLNEAPTGAGTRTGTIDTTGHAQPVGPAGSIGIDTSAHLPPAIFDTTHPAIASGAPPSRMPAPSDTWRTAGLANKNGTSSSAPSHVNDTIAQRSVNDDSARALRDSLAALKHFRDSLQVVENIRKQQALRDTTANRLAMRYYDLGRMFYLLGKKDSMVAYYQHALDVGATGDIVPRILYSYSLYCMDNGLYPDRVDSMMQIIADKYPRSEFGLLARLHLGLTEEYSVDSVENEYVSGERYMQINDDLTAERKFLNVYAKYPASDYAPQALYATGWMFENKHSQYDSAKYYYQLLVKTYPHSMYAASLQKLFASADTGKASANGQSPNTSRSPSGGATPTPGRLPPGRLPPGMIPPGSQPGMPHVPGASALPASPQGQQSPSGTLIGPQPPSGTPQGQPPSSGTPQGQQPSDSTIGPQPPSGTLRGQQPQSGTPQGQPPSDTTMDLSRHPARCKGNNHPARRKGSNRPIQRSDPSHHRELCEDSNLSRGHRKGNRLLIQR